MGRGRREECRTPAPPSVRREQPTGSGGEGASVMWVISGWSYGRFSAVAWALLVVANFVDDGRPLVSQRISGMAHHEHRKLSLASLIRARRVVLDIVKPLDHGEPDTEPLGYTDEEWGKLLGEGPAEGDS
jgi:hypothetical protein